ncbi:MAG: hypothetical protein JXA92_11385 [candidate division Zixibacteria bacterium]|nr:hypothetical protein [candidate division Zixibacteria bacterium]
MTRFIVLFILIILSLPLLAFSQAAVQGDEKYAWYIEQYPFLEGRYRLFSMETEFRWPEGYKKIDPSSLNSFQRWISELPLWQKGKPVGAYNRGILYKVGEFSRRIQLPWRTAHFTNMVVPLQLLCEFFHSRRQDHRIEIKPKKGELLTYKNWLNKEVIYDRTGSLTYQPSKKKEPSEEEFSRFFDIVALNTSYRSLVDNCEAIAENKLAPGDLFIATEETGRRGEVYIILNILINEQNDKLFVISTGCPEACDFHIPLFNDDEDYPWITLEKIKALAGEYPVSGFYRLKYR